MQELFPDLDPLRVARLRGGDQGRRLPAHLEARGAVEAAAAELPKPRQLRDLDREAGAVPRREGRGGRRLPADRDRGRAACSSPTGSSRGCARGTRGATATAGARELRAGLRRGREGHRAGRGHPGPPDRRGDRLLRAPGPPAAALGARGEGGLEGARSRSTGSSTRWAGRFASRRSTTSSAAASSTRWARTRSRIGLVVGLDYTDATFSVHDALQELKTHPFVRKILEGGERVAWGAKTIPSGGYWALPRKLAVPGMVMCGDNAGMCNVSELKGIHYAMHAGMYAAEEIVAALKRDSVNFDAYDERVRDSAIAEDLYRWRNVRQSFSKGFFFGGVIANAATSRAGASRRAAGSSTRTPRRRWTLGKARRRLPEAGQQVHLRQALLGVRLGQRDPRRRAEPHPGPARGSERGRAGLGLDVPGAGLRDPGGPARERRREVDLNITPSNCVQCGAITAKGGRLTPPEGGDGPLYQET